MFTYFASTPWGGKMDYLIEMVFADRVAKWAITDKWWRTFCHPSFNSGVHYYVHSALWGDCWETRMSLFALSYFLLGKRQATVRRIIYWSCSRGLWRNKVILYLGALFQCASVMLYNRDSSSGIWGPLVGNLHFKQALLALLCCTLKFENHFFNSLGFEVS